MYTKQQLKRLFKKFRQLSRQFPELYFFYGYYPETKKEAREIARNFRESLINYVESKNEEESSD